MVAVVVVAADLPAAVAVAEEDSWAFPPRCTTGTARTASAAASLLGPARRQLGFLLLGFAATQSCRNQRRDMLCRDVVEFVVVVVVAED